MKTFLVILVLVHGLIHLVGFVKPVSFGKDRSANSFSFLSRISWFLAFILLLFTAYSFFQGSASWWVLGMASIIVSQALVISKWTEAKWGTILNVVLLLAVIMGFGTWKYDRDSRKIETDFIMFAATQKNNIKTVSISDLPPIVQKWLMRSGMTANPSVQLVRINQKGKMKQKPGDSEWMQTQSAQLMSATPPLFFWTVKMEFLPGLHARGRDQFKDGKGSMQISASGLFRIVNDRGPEIDQGSLQRYISEMCWLPSVALSPYIQWQQVDSLSAMATMNYKGNSGSVVFSFTAEGDIFKCEADRYMSNGKETRLEKWQVVTRSWKEFNGIRVPAISEVTWKLKEGDFTWYEVEVEGVEVVGE